MSTICKVRASECESFETVYPLRQASRFSNPMISHWECWRQPSLSPTRATVEGMGCDAARVEPHCIHYSPSAFGVLSGRVDRSKTPLAYPCCKELALNSSFKMIFDVFCGGLANWKGLEAIESNGIQGG
jgi:hypothetical protein